MARKQCERCLRPVKQCLCASIEAVAAQTQVIILQHPSEQKHALNTARLVKLALADCQLHVGEDFSALQPILTRQGSYLLFPNANAMLANQVPEATVKQLIVLDGTWRKAKKILYLNPWLLTLPCLTLDSQLSSRYRLRKAPMAESLSTIEAVTYCLAALEPNHDFQPLLKPFDALIEGQIQAMGQTLYKQNYLTKDNK